MAISLATYRSVAAEDADATWELHGGRLVRKPDRTLEHNDVAWELARVLGLQLDPDLYRVRMNAGRLRVDADHYFVPDVAVIPVELAAARAGAAEVLEEYDEPLPFVAEVWSRSTGEYDVDRKLPAYQRRGDAEIWRVHPYERMVRRWQKSGGVYVEETIEDGVAVVEVLGARIEVDRLFRF
jgi:Uma2 family endonuclease